MKIEERLAAMTEAAEKALAHLSEQDGSWEVRQTLMEALRREACFTIAPGVMLKAKKAMNLPERVVVPMGTKLLALGVSDVKRGKIQCQTWEVPSGLKPFVDVPVVETGETVWVQPDWLCRVA